MQGQMVCHDNDHFHLWDEPAVLSSGDLSAGVYALAPHSCLISMKRTKNLTGGPGSPSAPSFPGDPGGPMKTLVPGFPGIPGEPGGPGGP